MRRRDIERLLALILPQPHPLATPWQQLDWAGFWAIFDARAPLHLRLGLPLAAGIVGHGYLRLRVGARWLAEVHGPSSPLDSELDVALDVALADAACSPLLGALVEVLKVVAALAYFDDFATDRAFRAAP